MPILDGVPPLLEKLTPARRWRLHAETKVIQCHEGRDVADHTEWRKRNDRCQGIRENVPEQDAQIALADCHGSRRVVAGFLPHYFTTDVKCDPDPLECGQE